MVSHKDLKVSKYEIGLTLLTGKKIKEVKGYLSREFDDVAFKLTAIVLEDDTEIDVEGEHDFPYLAIHWKGPFPPNMDDETMTRLYREQEGS